MNRALMLGAGLWCIAMISAGCTDNEEHVEKSGYSIHGDTITVQLNSWTRKLTVEKVKPFTYHKEIITAGTVRPIPTQYANVASPFAGRIVKSYVEMGEYVPKGTPLFAIICPDFTSAQKEYFQSRSTRELALKDLERKSDLSQQGVSSQRELEEAQTALLIAEKDLENAETALNVYQVEDLENMKLGQPLIIRAPISGILIENNIVNGQYIREDADPVAVVADLSKVWISAQVKEKDIRYIAEGSPLKVEIASYPNLQLDGKVYHVEEALDEDTRSIQVLSVCRNDDEKLKLGMYVTVHFQSAPEEMLLIPQTALLQGVDANYVFVEIAPHTYVKRDVEVEATNEKGAVIRCGLRAGERIITQGGYCLKL